MVVLFRITNANCCQELCAMLSFIHRVKEIYTLLFFLNENQFTALAPIFYNLFIKPCCTFYLVSSVVSSIICGTEEGNLSEVDGQNLNIMNRIKFITYVHCIHVIVLISDD